jgi:hypothetical protein
MKIFQLVYQQLETKTLTAKDMAEAHNLAQQFRKFNPSVTLLKITELDLNTFDPSAKPPPLNS